jgi:hypothetical protein
MEHLYVDFAQRPVCHFQLKQFGFPMWKRANHAYQGKKLGQDSDPSLQKNGKNKNKSERKPS